ncbi:hypothetical protein Pcinc_032405 [Petrolisthes cinctipes]|uniref:Uncharacterized protein n=1 Tax=Petrolisthes cinctipes TaxID=88211 RepID=A0AAE1K321_PETCI|nr:hypothetical protein Pcinc_032405 [Petrolisthes cinctipes]
MVLMLSLRHNHAVLYIGTCIFGTFLSSVYPTAVSLAETYIHVTSSMTSMLVVTAAAGEMIIPVLIGQVFEKLPSSVLIFGVLMTLLSFVLYFLLYLVAQTITRQSSEQNLASRLKTLLLRAGRRDLEAEEDTGLMKHHVKYYSRMRSRPSESSLGEEVSPGDTTETGQEASSISKGGGGRGGGGSGGGVVEGGSSRRGGGAGGVGGRATGGGGGGVAGGVGGSGGSGVVEGGSRKGTGGGEQKRKEGGGTADGGNLMKL